MSYVEPVPDAGEPRRCKATARSGERCKQPPIRGGAVCRYHGGHAPQVRRKAEQRLALAEVVRAGDRRHPWQVLLDALHVADSLMLRRVQEDESVTPETIDAIERAARFAKVTLDARALEFMQRHEAVQAEEIARVVEAALAAGNLTYEQQLAVRSALRRELTAIDNGDRRAIAGQPV